MPPRRRKLGPGGSAGKDATPRGSMSGIRRSDYPNAFNADGQQLGRNPAEGQARRRPLSPEQPAPGQNNARQAVGGINAARNRYERAMFGSPNPLPFEGHIQGIRTRHQDGETAFSPADVRDWIDEASKTLGPRAQQALRRAFEGDDSLLLSGEDEYSKDPTHTSSPRENETERRPRTLAAGYDEESQTLFVRFRGQRTSYGQWAPGVGYEYYGVTSDEWRRFRDGPSPGRMINNVLNGHPYTPAAW